MSQKDLFYLKDYRQYVICRYLNVFDIYQERKRRKGIHWCLYNTVYDLDRVSQNDVDAYLSQLRSFFGISTDNPVKALQ